jgi:uncharacterized protein (UPF0332 family)
MGINRAREHLSVAKSHLTKVQAYWEDPDTLDQAVTWAFYAYENAVVAAAEASSIPWRPTHPSKVEAAAILYERGIVPVDVGPLLARLNQARKDVAYGEPSELLDKIDAEKLVTDLEAFVHDVERYIESIE